MGTGICGFVDWGAEEKAEAERLREVERQREAAAAEWQAELRRRCAEIDKFAGKQKHMAAQLERHKPIVRPVDMARFAELRQFCNEHDWPTALPIMPHALFEFIVSENAKGYRHILAIVKSIAKIHEAAAEDACPSRDPLVKAYLELARDDENETLNQSEKD